MGELLQVVRTRISGYLWSLMHICN